APEAIERRAPGLDHARDIGFRLVAYLGLGQTTRHVHREKGAHRSESRMHFRRVGTCFGADMSVIGPELRFRMALGERLADRKAVPDDVLPAAVGDLEDR